MGNLRFFFAAAVFLAAFLLFLVEHMAARQLLPVLGGSASVWITCLVYFQTALLVGYLYAHWFAHRPQARLHLALLAAAAASAILWAVHPAAMANGAEHPIATVFVLLSATIGLPFLVLAATSPMMQVWWSLIEKSEIPWRLYALSNLASLLALIAYPWLVEPNLTLRWQRIVWGAGFVIFALITGSLSLRLRAAASQSVPAVVEEDAPGATLREKLLWVLLPMVASMQLCAITAYLTANVAAIPLLWVLPLGVYLITLILAFQFRMVLPWAIIARFMVVMLGGLAYSLSRTNVTWPLWLSILFFLIELFFACIFCHVAAVSLKPKRTSQSTLFYLLFAAGGALGSFLIGIVSPLLFQYNLDLPISFFMTALLALVFTWNSGWSQRMLWSVASIAVLVLVFWVRIVYTHDTIVTVRNFYASLRVTQDHGYPGATLRTLLNGSIQHGTQIFGTEELRHTPTTYYAPGSGVGLALDNCCENRPRSIGVVGLGTGTVAAYGRPGDHIRFYEINPAVEPIARNAFTYIRDSAASIEVVPGDARASLTREAPQNFDVLVVDAFSGDAIPVHLLTREAMELYRRHLAPGGILAFHISNQHVNLGPPIVLLAESAGMQVRRFSTVADETPGEYGSTWMLLTDNGAFFDLPKVSLHAHVPLAKPGLRLWTDDYSALLPVLH